MIAALLVLLGVVLVVLPGLFRSPLRLPAAEWARIAAVSLLLGFAAVEFGLVLLALPTVLRALHAAGFAAICENVLTPLAPGGDLIGWSAGAVALVVAVRARRAASRARRNTEAVEAEPWLGRHEHRGDFELVVLPTRELLAVSVPAPLPQVLISDGLVERLDGEQLEAVIRHEASHHRFRHWRFSLLAAAVEHGLWPLPLVARATNALRCALEGWADEAAAGDSASGRAVVRDALVAVGGPIDERARSMPKRVLRDRAHRLDHGPSPRASALRFVVHAPVLVLGVTTVVLLAGWVAGAHHAMALTGYCPD
jgi:Zn-dependent protease with chaperone function